MKEKVERLAKGIFEYETPNLLISEKEIQITVEAGKTYSGSFTIQNSKNTPIKGVLYTSGKLLELEQDRFKDIGNEIEYSFKSDNRNAGETMKGEICVVTDCGEMQIPLTINTEVPYFNSSLGKIKDLYNFANLAKSDWLEALRLFKSEEFKLLISNYEVKYNNLYQGLLKSTSSSEALEEFLIAIHKKLQINFAVDKNVFDYKVTDGFMDKITLTKDNWGYAKIQVSTDAPFISLEHKILWSDNFIGNTYNLEFVIHPEFLRTGNNFGKIYLKTVYQTISVEVICRYHNGEVDKSQNRKINSYTNSLTVNYLNFRVNKIPINKYVMDSTILLDKLCSVEDRDLDRYQLLRTHLLIISEKNLQGEQILNELGSKEEQWKLTDVVTYCGYLYLRAMLSQEDEYIERARDSVRVCYEAESEHWELLWLLLYMDKKYERNNLSKLEKIRQQYAKGCHSPILYYEAVTVWNEEPSCLHELGEFELHALHWGIKWDYLKKDAALQFTYLAGKYKNFNKLVYRSLAKIYYKFELKDTLTVICSMLIKGHQRGSQYFEWFLKGVKEQLRITELHEYFMYTLEEKPDTLLPQPILLYFVYNSNLNDRKKAYLYAYVIRNKDTLPVIYRTYYKHMASFALKQLTTHNISTNLAVLYEEMIAQEGLTIEVARELPFVLFRYEIYCSNPNMKGVFVIHKELEEEIYTPLVSGEAQITVFTENVEILLVDGNDNRYGVTVPYTLNKLMHWEEYINTCYDMHVNSLGILLNLSEKAQNYQKFDEKSVDMRKQIQQLPGLLPNYYRQNLLDLIFYYYDNFEGEQLDSYLFQIESQGLDKVDRDKIIELFIIRGLYDKALESLEKYGFEGIAVNRLMKLCTNLLQKRREEELEIKILVDLSYYIFKAGKYNEEILEYLVTYYYGATGEMFTLWKAATAFEIQTESLEERLLAQMLFAESYITDSLSVFLQYYKRGCNHKLIKAFLSYNAYKYLIKGRVLHPELFNIMKKEVMYEENEICTLALISEYSKKDLLTEGEIDFADYNIHKLVKRGLILPYFQKFQNKVPIPPRLFDKYYVEYKTSPLHKVMIHYLMESKHGRQDFITEEMKNSYLGIYVKEFILFYNERVQYYITEEDENGEAVITESVTIQLNHNKVLEEDTRYNHINYMLTAIDMQDDTTLLDSMYQYVKNDYVISKLFKPL